MEREEEREDALINNSKKNRYFQNTDDEDGCIEVGERGRPKLRKSARLARKVSFILTLLLILHKKTR